MYIVWGKKKRKSYKRIPILFIHISKSMDKEWEATYQYSLSQGNENNCKGIGKKLL